MKSYIEQMKYNKKHVYMYVYIKDIMHNYNYTVISRYITYETEKYNL